EPISLETFALFSMVLNNPSRFTDAFGMKTKCGSITCDCTGKNGKIRKVNVRVYGESNVADLIFDDRGGCFTVGGIRGPRIFCTASCKQLKAGITAGDGTG